MTTHNILTNLFENKNHSLDDNIQSELSNIHYMKKFINRQDQNSPINPTSSSWEYFNIDDYVLIAKKFTINRHSNLTYFIVEVLNLSNKKNHHPEIIINHNTVEIRLHTSDMNDVTDLDLRLSKDIDEIYDDVSFIDEIK